MRIPELLLSASCILAGTDAVAQLRMSHFLQDEGHAVTAPAPAPAPGSGEPGTTGERSSWSAPPGLQLRNAGLIAGAGLVVGAYGAAKWWDDGFTGTFRTESEGWFGQDTRYGGADKLGHAFMSYLGARLLAQGFEAVGNRQGTAATLGFWTSVGIMTAVEVLDGYSRQYRFSKEDAIINVVGAGVGYLLERNPGADRLLDFRFLYRKSQDSHWDPGGDYSGQTYLLVAKASGVPALQQNSVLRYLEFAVGYGTRGYDVTPGARGQRNLYYGISLNLSEVLAQTVFRGAKERGAAQRGSDLFLEFIQVPGTAALARHPL